MRLTDRITNVEERVGKLEVSQNETKMLINELVDIKTTVDKLARYVKVAAPSIVSAALAAGLVNGKLGAFLHALVGG